ncbi:MAG TPA: ISKra4 family transposase, partial [Chloroflexota bacterium]
MRSVEPADAGFSPLDEELGLVPGVGSPTLLAGLVRLGSALPFAQAAEALAFFWQVQLSTSSVLRQTETAGAAWVALQSAAVTLLERETPPPAAGPARQLLSVDGAMVPLVGGVWAEVKTLTLGSVSDAAAGSPHTSDLSYFSRMSDAATFVHQALVEVQRRGVATAGSVVAVADGAEWIQGFVDHHRPDAVRILDFPHAVEYLTTAIQTCFSAGTPCSRAWETTLRHELRHGDPATVLEALARLPVAQARDPAAAV